jgi:hypothetical protein
MIVNNNKKDNNENQSKYHIQILPYQDVPLDTKVAPTNSDPKLLYHRVPHSQCTAVPNSCAHTPQHSPRVTTAVLLALCNDQAF